MSRTVPSAATVASPAATAPVVRGGCGGGCSVMPRTLTGARRGRGEPVPDGGMPPADLLGDAGGPCRLRAQIAGQRPVQHAGEHGARVGRRAVGAARRRRVEAPSRTPRRGRVVARARIGDLHSRSQVTPPATGLSAGRRSAAVSARTPGGCRRGRRSAYSSAAGWASASATATVLQAPRRAGPRRGEPPATSVRPSASSRRRARRDLLAARRRADRRGRRSGRSSSPAARPPRRPPCGGSRPAMPAASTMRMAASMMRCRAGR